MWHMKWTEMDRDSVYKTKINTRFPIISEQVRKFYEYFNTLAGIQKPSEGVQLKIPVLRHYKWYIFFF
jgi:hypothetical protein